MTQFLSDAAGLRLSAVRGGAVSRVGAVSGAERSQPVDPARATDLRWPQWPPWPRPDPARIAIADITQFQGLVYGPAGRPLSQGLPGGLALAGAAPAAAAPHPQPHPLAPPADRIAYTLQHLRGLRGL